MVRIIRVGSGTNDVDNFHSGGVYSFFDEEGFITKPAIDREGTVHEEHPLTKTSFVGFKIPYCQEALDLCKTASKKIPQIAYVGWDIAITPQGPVILEGNELPGYDLYQSKVHLDENLHGLKPAFDAVIYGERQGG